MTTGQCWTKEKGQFHCEQAEKLGIIWLKQSNFLFPMWKCHKQMMNLDQKPCILPDNPIVSHTYDLFGCWPSNLIQVFKTLRRISLHIYRNTCNIFHFIRGASFIMWTCLDSYSCVENIIESYLRVNMHQMKSQDMKSISKSNNSTDAHPDEHMLHVRLW